MLSSANVRDGPRHVESVCVSLSDDHSHNWHSDFDNVIWTRIQCITRIDQIAYGPWIHRRLSTRTYGPESQNTLLYDLRLKTLSDFYLDDHGSHPLSCRNFHRRNCTSATRIRTNSNICVYICVCISGVWAWLSRQWFLDRVLSTPLLVRLAGRLDDYFSVAKCHCFWQHQLLFRKMSLHHHCDLPDVLDSWNHLWQSRLQSSKWYHMLLRTASLLYPSRPQFSSPVSLSTSSWCRLLRHPWLRPGRLPRSLLEWLIQKYNVLQLWHLAQLILKLPFYLSSLSCDGLSRSTMSNTLCLLNSERDFVGWASKTVQSRLTLSQMRPALNLVDFAEHTSSSKPISKWSEAFSTMRVIRRPSDKKKTSTPLHPDHVPRHCIVNSLLQSTRIPSWFLHVPLSLFSLLFSPLPLFMWRDTVSRNDFPYFCCVLQSLSDDTRIPLIRWPSKKTTPFMIAPTCLSSTSLLGHHCFWVWALSSTTMRTLRAWSQMCLACTGTAFDGFYHRSAANTKALKLSRFMNFRLNDGRVVAMLSWQAKPVSVRQTNSHFERMYNGPFLLLRKW